MKTEHFEAIERAKMHGVMPSVLAHQLLVRDLVEAAMFEWQNIAAPFRAGRRHLQRQPRKGGPRRRQ